MDPFAYCEQLGRDADKDRFLASLFAPAQRRGALFALYAFNAEIARIRDAIHEPMAGEVRLQWWRDAVERPGAGEARGNPVAAALLDTIVRFRLPVGSIVGLLEARAFDLYNDPMPTLAALEGYAHDTASTLIGLAARILDGDHAAMATALRDAGMAYAITGLLRAFPLHASRGQLYVPLDVLERHGAKPEDIFAGRTTPELSAALAEMHRLARTHFDACRATDVPPGIAVALLPVALVPIYLAQLDRSQPFRPVEVPQWRRQWALWRAARRL
jgi:phytoene synthase